MVSNGHAPEAEAQTLFCHHCGRRTLHERAAYAMVCRDCDRGTVIVAAPEGVAFTARERKWLLFLRWSYRTGRLTEHPTSAIARLLARARR